MDPPGFRAGASAPQSEDLAHSKAALAQQLLTNRLVRSRGQAFHPAVAAPAPAAASGAQLGATQQQHKVPHPPAAGRPDDVTVVPSQSSQFSNSVAGSGSLATTNAGPAAVVRVPRPLQVLLGNKLSIRNNNNSSSSNASTNAASAAAAESAAADSQSQLLASLSRTGRLPTSKAALDALHSSASGYSEPSNAFATSSRNETESVSAAARTDLITPAAAAAAGNKSAGSAAAAAAVVGSTAAFGAAATAAQRGSRERGNRDVARPAPPSSVAEGASTSASERARRQVRELGNIYAALFTLD